MGHQQQQPQNRVGGMYPGMGQTAPASIPPLPQQPPFMTPAPAAAVPGVAQPSYFAPPTATASVPDPMAMPPRPTSASGAGGQVSSGRVKYPRDPSVQSGMGTGYGSQNYFNPAAAPLPQQPQQTQPQMTGGFMSSGAPPVPGQMFTPQPTGQMGYGGGGMLDPMGQGMGQQMPVPPPPIGKNPTPPPGWNDPPSFTSNRQSKAQVSGKWGVE